LSFVPWDQRKAVASSLRAIYNAESEAAASLRLDEFEAAWGAKYPMIVRSWRANWAQLTGFLAFPVEVRKLIYTTNAIESLNFQLRKVIKSKGHFPSEDAALKLLYLALRNVERKWLRAARDWRSAVAQITVGEERLRGA
jgi:transposase-like protein